MVGPLSLSSIIRYTGTSILACMSCAGHRAVGSISCIDSPSIGRHMHQRHPGPQQLCNRQALHVQQPGRYLRTYTERIPIDVHQSHSRRHLMSSCMAAVSNSSSVPSKAAADASWLGSQLGAYIDAGLCVNGATKGPLAGNTVAIKDLFDIAGHRTGFGHPLWQQTHPPAEHTAPVIQRLLDAGASVRGRTHMDELAYSLNGENYHYGTPTNPAAPGRIPGGSSSGSAVAVAAGHVDIGLGSDTGGSVRVPASYCGVFGFRPTHGRVSLVGARPLAQSFDTAGWFTRRFNLLQDVSKVLLDPPSTAHSSQGHITQLLWPADAWTLAQQPTAEALLQTLAHSANSTAQHSYESLLSEVPKQLPAKLGLKSEVMHVDLGQGKANAASAGVQEAGQQLQQLGLNSLTDWLDVFRVTQAAEIWQEHGGWITQHQPHFGPGIKERFAMAAAITQQELEPALLKRKLITAFLHQLLQPEGPQGGACVMVLPTVPGPAPLCNTPAAALDDWRRRLISLTCIAGLAGLPQVSLPLATVDGLPVGLSLIGPPGGDEALLEVAARLVQGTQPDLL